MEQCKTSSRYTYFTFSFEKSIAVTKDFDVMIVYNKISYKNVSFFCLNYFKNIPLTLQVNQEFSLFVKESLGTLFYRHTNVHNGTKNKSFGLLNVSNENNCKIRVSSAKSIVSEQLIHSSIQTSSVVMYSRAYGSDDIYIICKRTMGER